MADACFSLPRLAEIYDALHGDRSDLQLYASIVAELGAQSLLDVGCGTGTLACQMAQRGLNVAGVDPAAASLAVAGAKSAGERVRWQLGSAADYDGPVVDLVTMTGNVAQVFLTDPDWHACLKACHDSLRPGGWLAFESRNPQRQAWREWSPDLTRQSIVTIAGRVTAWCEVTDVALPLVSFRWTYAFDNDGSVLTSDSTLRFRNRDELTASLVANGLAVDDVRDTPDRPGAEFVFLARAV